MISNLVVISYLFIMYCLSPSISICMSALNAFAEATRSPTDPIIIANITIPTKVSKISKMFWKVKFGFGCKLENFAVLTRNDQEIKSTKI